MTDKIGAFQNELKSRVLPVEPIKKEAFQDKLKDTVAQVSAKAAAANVERPKDFYLGFAEYQSKPPDDKAAPALARELRAIEMVMGALIKTGGLELEEFHREPLREEAGGGKRRSAADRSDHAAIERNGLTLKFTSNDDALRKVLTELANHKEQLFIIRNVTVQNKMMESPPRLAGAPAAPAPEAAATPATPANPATPASPAAPAIPPPAAPAPAANEGPLAYVFGTEKITSIVELEILNIEEPKSNSEKPEKGAKKKDK